MNELAKNSIIGAAKPRIDGPKKVSGQARYAADHPMPGLVYGYGVFSTVPKGRVVSIDTASAKAMAGVIDVFHHGNFPSLYRTPNSMEDENHVDETRLPFEDDKVYYPGQFVAMVVASSFALAREAARQVKVTYKAEKPITTLAQAKAAGVKPKPDKESAHERGKPDEVFAKAKHRIDLTYTTPIETHNPMEMHATTAVWEDGSLLMYEATQGVVFARNTMAAIFGLPPERVEVRAPFIGSGFGSKLWIWPHAIATAAIARAIGRPVQFVVPRAQMFTTTGHRPVTEQQIRMSTDEQGRLTSLTHETLNTTSPVGTVAESAGRCTSSLYACPNVRVTHATVETNVSTPTAMRAPGAAPGLFALESAMDEMAEALAMDPLEFRKVNYTERDQSKDLPFSSIHLLEAFERGAKEFGWAKRNPKIGSMREGNEVIGWGLAACNWEALKMACEARVSLRADGTVFGSCATQDIGTGTYNVIAQTLAAVTGIDLDRIEVKIGDSSYARGPISGGSWATATVMPAISQAAQKAIEQLGKYAVDEGGAFAGADPKALKFANGKLIGPNGRSIDFTEILRQKKIAAAEGTTKTSAEPSKEYSCKSFGAHFVEVRWDPGISRLRVSRVVSAIDAGQIVNEKTAANQVEGAIVMGMGMALFEHTEYDLNSGRPVNTDLAEYLMPVHADQPPELKVILLKHPDYNFSEFGVRGIGEIGITGLAGAIANAVYHATGKRIRDLPITLDKLITG